MEHDNPTLSAAYDYGARGWRVLRVYKTRSDGTCACGRTDEHAIGKHPIDRGWPELASSRGPDIHEWFGTNPPNLGIATGEESGIWVLDVDPDKGGDESLRDLEAEYGLLPATRMHRTGSGGEHFFFTWPGFDVSNSAGMLGEGLDVRGNRGQVVAPPSLSGRGEYAVVNDVEVAAAPEWLLEMVRLKERVLPAEVAERRGELPARYVESALAREAEALSQVSSNRNDALNTSAFKLATMIPHGVITGTEIIQALEPVAMSLGLGTTEVAKTLDSAIAGGVAKPRDPWPPRDRSAGLFIPFLGGGDDEHEWPMREWNDFGNARRLVDHHPNRLLWIEQAGRWAVYQGSRWELDETRLGQQLAQDTIEALAATEALSYSDEKGPKGEPSERELFLGWVKSQKMAGKIRGMIETARAGHGMSTTMEGFDANPWLLNCRNGILDMQAMEMREHSPLLRQMAQVAADYDPDATCPRWQAFLERMQPNPDVRRYVQRALGYSMTGDISEQKLFMHLGEGANGKSVMIEVMSTLMDTYGQAIPRETLVVTKNEAIPTDVARMVRKRFLQASESGVGRVLDEEKVKGLTGGEAQSARFMRQDFFDFTPTGKIHYVTNHFPKVSPAPSIWRRLVVIKWPVVIDDTDPTRDRKLAQKIIAEELSGVLAWCVRGLADYLKVGLEEPALIREWTREYRSDADELAEWIEDRLDVDPAFPFLPTQALFDSYVSWVESGRRGRPMAQQTLSKALAERGFEKKTERVSGRLRRGFVGLSVRSRGAELYPPAR